MTPFEHTRAELREAACHYYLMQHANAGCDDDRMVSVIARLEVAAKAFVESSHVQLMTEAQQWVLDEYNKSKTPPGNHSDGAS